MELTIHPLTPDRWNDLETIFNARGCSVARGCWCMYYRQTKGQEDHPLGTSRAQQRRKSLKALVDAGNPVGLIAYDNQVPVGWVSLGPREEFARLRRSPVMKPLDDEPVWSVICFVVPPKFRGRGIAHKLLKGAITYAEKCGATLLEAYPVDKPHRSENDSMWFGAKSMYDAAGFKEVARRKPHRPVVRIETTGGI